MTDPIIKKYNQDLRKLSDDLDISPTKFMQATRSYQAVGKHLDIDYPNAEGRVQIYPQGSFALGTVVKPLKDHKEPEYDIDLVCQLDYSRAKISPKKLKEMVGNRLIEDKRYAEMIDDEGRRCWTLHYAPDADGFGFHIDVLPCILEDGIEIMKINSLGNDPTLSDTTIAITHKHGTGQGASYSWTTSNPSGYVRWFERRNAQALTEIEHDIKKFVFDSTNGLFAKIEDVPKQLVKTPLQRSVQILKRHRDVHFNGAANEAYKPISMIITTLAAHLYGNEKDVANALTSILEKMRQHSVLLGGQVMRGTPLIHRTADGKWHFPNPVNFAENFADRWHEDNHARAQAFFQWTAAAYGDLVSVLQQKDSGLILKSIERSLGFTQPQKSNTAPFVPKAPATIIRPDDAPYTAIPANPSRPWRGE